MLPTTAATRRSPHASPQAGWSLDRLGANLFVERHFLFDYEIRYLSKLPDIETLNSEYLVVSVVSASKQVEKDKLLIALYSISRDAKEYILAARWPGKRLGKI